MLIDMLSEQPAHFSIMLGSQGGYPLAIGISSARLGWIHRSPSQDDRSVLFIDTFINHDWSGMAKSLTPSE